MNLNGSVGNNDWIHVLHLFTAIAHAHTFRGTHRCASAFGSVGGQLLCVSDLEYINTNKVDICRYRLKIQSV